MQRPLEQIELEVISDAVTTLATNKQHVTLIVTATEDSGIVQWVGKGITDDALIDLLRHVADDIENRGITLIPPNMN